MKTTLSVALLALVVSSAGAQTPTGWSQSAGASPPPPAGNTAPAGQTWSGREPLPPPSLYPSAQAALSPLPPEDIRRLRGLQAEVDRAMTSPPVAVVPRIRALTVDLSPGASLPLVRTAIHYPSSLSFIDSTGAAWALGAAPLSGHPGIKVYWVPDSPVMVVEALQPYISGTVTVYLAGLSVPVVLNVTSGEPDTAAVTWTTDSRLDLRIPQRGPSAVATAAPAHRIGLHDATLQAFLDGIPPKGAKPLKVSGSVPDTLVWQLGDDVYIRSRAELRDEFEATLSSADGTHLWKLPVTPYAAFSVMGRTATLTIALE